MPYKKQKTIGSNKKDVIYYLMIDLGLIKIAKNQCLSSHIKAYNNLFTIDFS